MRKILEIKKILYPLLIILAITIITVPFVYSAEEYNHIWSAESRNPESNSWYGYQAEIYGNHIITNEPYANVDDVESAGKAHLFDLEGNLLQTFQSPNPGESNVFGYRLDIYEDLIAIGEHLAHVDGKRWAGKVHVFKTDGTLLYTLQPQVPYNSSNFGFSVELGKEILVIAERAVERTPPVQGKVHIYDHNGEVIKTILSPDPISQGLFGKTVEVGEDLILVSQYGDPEGNLITNRGFVYVFDYEGNLVMTLEAPEKEEYTCFGISVSISARAHLYIE